MGGGWPAPRRPQVVCRLLLHVRGCKAVTQVSDDGGIATRDVGDRRARR